MKISPDRHTEHFLQNPQIRESGKDVTGIEPVWWCMPKPGSLNFSSRGHILKIRYIPPHLQRGKVLVSSRPSRATAFCALEPFSHWSAATHFQIGPQDTRKTITHNKGSTQAYTLAESSFLLKCTKSICYVLLLCACLRRSFNITELAIVITPL